MALGGRLIRGFGFEAPVKRQHRIAIRLSDDELARLDELRPRGVARAVYLRQLLREPAPPDVASPGSWGTTRR